MAMAKTTVKPWRKEGTLAEIQSTEPLTKAEEEEVSDGIRVAFGWCCGDEPLPSTGEIKQAMHNPALAKKITNIRFR